jgi:uncharacterized protein YdeI (YjbR/CyaY-like superfamily)
MATDLKSGLPILGFASGDAWRDWLAAQPRTSKGLWLKLAKKDSGIASVSKQEAIDGALCHGWIDGQLDKFDDRYWLTRFTPRKPKSKWSEVNRTRAISLIEQGLMRPAGLKEIDDAKADGRWNAAYAPQRTVDIPVDLQRALDAVPRAKRLFEALDSANRYAILYRVQTAKTPEKRAMHIEKHVAMLARGETIHPQRTRRRSPDESPR